VIAAVILVAALALRVAEVEGTSYRPINDAGSYLTLASEIAHTGDYPTQATPGKGAGGTLGPSAYFPPAFPYFLAAADLVSGHTTRRGAAIQSARVSQAVLGTATVAMIGLVALEAFGPLVALTAMGLAAIYPVLIEDSGVLVAENLLTLLVLAAVWAVLRARRAARPYAWIAGAGVLVGLATLAHENGVLIAIPLALAAWSTTRKRTRAKALAAPALLLACAAITIVPWAIRNAIVLHRFIPVSDETGITLVGTYNAASAANPVVPYKWRLYYGIPGERPLIRQAGTLTEPELGDRLLHQAFHYIGDHPFSPLAAGFHNTLRLFELEGTFAWHASAKALDIPTRTAEVGVFSFWLLCLIAIGGLFTRAVRTAPRWLWLVPLLLALSVVLVNVETPRFREPVDPFLIMLAACAIAALGTRLHRGSPVGGQDRPAVAAGQAQLVEVGERLP
jgi:4-amino-4-deoxy-L-arabinose transferase-like glycosyltransferase